METAAIRAMHPLGLLGRLASLSKNRPTRGVVARMYPVMMIKHICIPKDRSTQNPLPQFWTSWNAVDFVKKSPRK
jgi:hypothetical protein